MLSEEALYEQVADELMQGEIRRGLWTMALTNAMGDERLARSFYVKLRVTQLDEEQQAEMARCAADEAALAVAEERMQVERSAMTSMLLVGALGVATLVGLIGIALLQYF